MVLPATPPHTDKHASQDSVRNSPDLQPSPQNREPQAVPSPAWVGLRFPSELTTAWRLAASRRSTAHAQSSPGRCQPGRLLQHLPPPHAPPHVGPSVRTSLCSNSPSRAPQAPTVQPQVPPRSQSLCPTNSTQTPRPRIPGSWGLEHPCLCPDASTFLREALVPPCSHILDPRCWSLLGGNWSHDLLTALSPGRGSCQNTILLGKLLT